MRRNQLAVSVCFPREPGRKCATEQGVGANISNHKNRGGWRASAAVPRLPMRDYYLMG